jgi:DNA-binding NtrC family response regulator
MKASAMALDNIEPKPGEADLPRGRILIVDDEEVIGSTLKEFLEGENFLVVTAQDLKTAVERVESFEPEIVLCDVQLPGADGITVLNRVLQIRPDTLFVMITAYATVENAVSAFQRGAQDYLIKPVLFEDLLTKIDRLIRFRRLLQENQALKRQLHSTSSWVKARRSRP